MSNNIFVYIGVFNVDLRSSRAMYACIPHRWTVWSLKYVYRIQLDFRCIKNNQPAQCGSVYTMMWKCNHATI